MGPEGRPVEEPNSRGPGGLLGRPVTRRSFIAGAAGLAGAAYITNLVGAGPLAWGPFRALVAGAGTVSPPSRTPDFTIAAEREADLVLADFRFYGFSMQTPKGVPTLVPTVSSGAGPGNATSNVIVVTLPPQCIGEAAYFVSPSAGDYQSQAPLPVDPPPIVSAVAGPSRLCFTLPAGANVPLPNMSVDDLLDWSSWSLLVPTTAQVNPPGPNGYPLPYAPGPFETAIEFPYALFLSPVVFVSADVAKDQLAPSYRTFFGGRAKPLYNGKVADLWTATLGRTNTLAGDIRRSPTPPPQVVAVWAADYPQLAALAATPSATEADMVQYQPAPPK